MGVLNIYLDYLLCYLVVFSFLVLSQSPVRSDNCFRLLFSLPSLLKYEKILQKKSKVLCHRLILSSPPWGIFHIYWIVSVGILVVSLTAASSLCSGTDSATTYANRNHTSRCTGGKIEPLEPVNLSSHFFAGAVGSCVSWDCHFFAHVLALHLRCVLF